MVHRSAEFNEKEEPVAETKSLLHGPMMVLILESPDNVLYKEADAKAAEMLENEL